MDSHNSANISSQIPSASSDGQVLYGVQPVGVDHEVAVVLVDGWSLASVSVVEELWQGLSFDIIDVVHVEPAAVTWENYRVCLRDKVFPRRRLGGSLRLLDLALSLLAFLRIVLGFC